MTKRIATHAHRSKYPNPIAFGAGDDVTIGGRNSDEYPGWVWTTTAEGNAGWAPESILERGDGDTARAIEAYTARELDTEIGDELVVVREQAGWCWVRNARGEEGWVPAETTRPAETMRPAENESFTLPDGRRLGFRVLGDPDGPALFFFHGTPGSRLTFEPDDVLVRSLGARFIAPERPGYGISDPKPDRTLLDWPDDVVALADHLGVGAFAVAGESGGGPHALVCAFRCPERVTKALVFASPGPADFRGATRGMSIGNRLGLAMNRYAPWLVRRMTRGFATAFAKDPQRTIDAMARQMAATDRALLQDAALREAIIRDVREAYRQGADGHAVDGRWA